MTKLDLALISQQGHGQRVPKEMDRQMVKYVIGLRKEEVQAALANNDRRHFETEIWDHSDVFYFIRTWLNQHGWDTSVYTDAVEGGSNRRKELYDMIQEVCEKDYGVKRHQIAIFPADRAYMAFNGSHYSASFDQLASLMYRGTDIIVVEKYGTVVKMIPFTQKMGIAFIQSQGFVSEYGIALARLANGQTHVAKDYNIKLDDVPTDSFSAHLGVLTDCDSSGLGIGIKIPGAVRLGIDVNTLSEINAANPGLNLKLKDVVEGTKVNTHYKALINLLHYKGNLYDEIISSAASKQDAIAEIRARSEYLMQTLDLNGRGNGSNNASLVEYLANNRIELNTVLAAVKPPAFWNWLKAKILEVWHDRNGNRAIRFDDYLLTDTQYDFIEYMKAKGRPVIKDDIKDAMYYLWKVEGFIDDVDKRKEEIEDDILNSTLLENKDIQELDKTLQKIMDKDKIYNKDKPKT
jgi:hypothetical protein